MYEVNDYGKWRDPWIYEIFYHFTYGSWNIADSVRKHWSIENLLHCCLDVVFREDASRARKNNSPLNLNVLRKTVLNLVSQAQYKRISKKRLMFRAALEPTLFLDILLTLLLKSKCCCRDRRCFEAWQEPLFVLYLKQQRIYRCKCLTIAGLKHPCYSGYPQNSNS